ncbi:hypothetical protein MTO96_027748, partial [Rhipicephalus appendiculatus]
EDWCHRVDSWARRLGKTESLRSILSTEQKRKTQSAARGKVKRDESVQERVCEDTGDYGDAERKAAVRKPTVDEAPGMAAVEDRTSNRPTAAAKGAQTKATGTAAAATKAKVKEEAASGVKGERP